MAIEYVGTALLAGKAVFDMASAYGKAKQQGEFGVIRSNAEKLRAQSAIDDAAAAREEWGMARSMLDVGDLTAAAQVNENAARFGKLSLDRGMIDLEAEQQEQQLRRQHGIASDSDVAMAAAMGIDPGASASFVTHAAEQQRIAGEMIQNIRLNRMSSDVALTAEEVGLRGRQAQLINQQASLAMERGSQARALQGIGAAERNSTYARFVASATGQAYADMANNAWMAGVSSLIGSATSIWNSLPGKGKDPQPPGGGGGEAGRGGGGGGGFGGRYDGFSGWGGRT